jgi:hypothetical protein
MGGTENTSKAKALFLARLAQAEEHGLPMPFQVYFDTAGGVTLRYRTAEEVDAALAVIGGTAVHDNYTHDTEGRAWHAYGNKYGDARRSFWAFTDVQVWAAIEGPTPEVES